MAAPLEVKDGGCIEVCCPLLNMDDPEYQESPVFILMGNPWIIKFFYYKNGSYEACIQPKHNLTEFKTFFLDFTIGFKKEENLSLGKGYIKITSPHCWPFWDLREDILKTKLPSDYLTGNLIKFVLRFYFPKKITLELSDMSQDKCMRTTSLADATSMSSLCKDFSMMLESALYYDVQIKCAQQTIKAHRSILSARSEVFKPMLQTNMVKDQTCIVEIKDIDVDCIKDFVKYLYTDTLPELTFDKAKKFYEVGVKYKVQSLLVRCLEYLQNNLSRVNVCECLAWADIHNNEKFKDKVVAYIAETKLFLEDEFWTPFCKQYPKIALDVYKLSYKNASKH